MIEIAAEEIDGAVFDLDGVLTDTARIHAAAWKETFDRALTHLGVRGEAGRPFDVQTDYLRHVDGRSRLDGVRTFLAARGITLAEGDADDTSLDTVAGIGRAKNRLVTERLARDSQLLPGARDLVEHMKAAGKKVAVASSSSNCPAVLAAVGLTETIDARVDGVDLARLALPGKPAPDLFLEALRRIGVGADRAVIFEDAEAGIEAGRRAGFGIVVGIAQTDDQAKALRSCGADKVVENLSKVKLVTTT